MSRDDTIKIAAWLKGEIVRLEPFATTPIAVAKIGLLKYELYKLDDEIAKNPIAVEQWENMKHGVKFHGTEAEFVIGLESQKRNIGRR